MAKTFFLKVERGVASAIYRIAGDAGLSGTSRCVEPAHRPRRRWILDSEGPRTFIKPGRRNTYRIAAQDLDLVQPSGQKLKWDVSVRLPDGRRVKVPGDRDPSTARRIGDRVDLLVKAKANGDPPPGELKVWIDNMPATLARRLVELGLLDQRRVDRLKTIDEQIDAFERVVAARKTNTAQHAKRTAACVRRLMTEMKITLLSQVPVMTSVVSCLIPSCVRSDFAQRPSRRSNGVR